ncbi:serine/threonine-protein kinase Nek1 isoform X2 [Clupea harengus]|uniref:non-specific serine/threonine protein kinase n=1 Tax=Clupea harengus TaxID=7950 RepID=A0A8M1KR12_CLUHA|nr:serine/threonine-protein kinase Nek1 isoform X2 [Clupea harengus]
MEKYEKVKKIGEGSFGKAFLVQSKEDGHQYVIKEIGISRMSNKERQESRKEVAVLANMSHPNIVQYKESFEESGCLYIVMDYCEGGDLFKKINSQRGLLFPEEQILDWFAQISLALKHVHDRKILHRDIKSQNIFLTKDGTVQLGDFGIARVLNSTVELARTCIGTPYYLSPEICENKPYNNKSDVWALGCVLYEMCTLKHAFEAGNMKNLVLKIIRGSYPPVSSHYSQDLRCMLGQLFRRNPRERPSVCSILGKPFLSRRIHRFLTPQLIAQEFSPGALHKHPKVCVAQGPPAKRPASGPAAISPAQKITKPAAKYGVPLTVRRPSDALRKAADAGRKPAERKPVAKPKQEAARKRRLELMEKEKKKREQIFLLKAAQIRRFEKDKVSHINRAREQGWRHVLSSSGGSSPERKFYGGGGGMMAASPAHAPSHAPAQPPNRYDHFLSALDQLAKPQEGAKAAGDTPARGAMGAAAPALPNGHVGPSGLARPHEGDAVKVEVRRLEQVSKNANANRLRGQVAAGRAFQVEEFLQRKREAMLNKVRAEGQLGARQKLTAVFGSRPGTMRCRRPRVNKEEEEYLSRLRQIRLQNFNERQQIKARLRGEKYDSDGSDSHEPSEEAELRKKKIEALKAQANTRAAVLKEQLEKKRREAYEREKRAWDDHLNVRGVKIGGVAAVALPPSPPPDPAPQPAPTFPPPPSSKPTAPSISMTAALKDVGALASGQNSPMKEESPKMEAPVVQPQSEKKEILRRLNENLKAHSQTPGEGEAAPAVTEVTEVTEGPCPALQQDQPVVMEEERPVSGGDRKKWEAGAAPVFPVAQQTLEETCLTSPASQSVSPDERLPSAGDRRKWEMTAPPFLAVAQQTLEETCIPTPEQTAGEVIRLEAWQGAGPRRAWGQSPDAQVLEMLKEAELQPLTQLLDNASICDRPVTDCLRPSVGPSTGQEGTRPAPQTQTQPSTSATAPETDEPIPLEVEGEEEATVSAEETLVPQPQSTDGAGDDACTDEVHVSAGGQSGLPVYLSNYGGILLGPTRKQASSAPIKLGFGCQLGMKRKTALSDELESLVLEERPQRPVNPPAGVLHAWGPDASPAGPPGGKTAPHTEKREPAESEEKPAEPSGVPPCDEPLFLRLCSPAHRRTVALALMSAQSSMEDSSSSLASRSRSISPMRSKHQDTLLIGLSTGLFDTNNTKMLRTCSLPDLSKLYKSADADTDVTEGNGAVAPDNNLEIEDLEENGKAEEQSEAEDAYEDEDDLRELRASMERLLQDAQSEEEEEEEEEDASNGSPGDEDESCYNGAERGAEKKGQRGSTEEEEEEVDGGFNGVGGEEEEGTSSSSPDEEPLGPLTNGVEEEEEEEEEEEHHSSGDQLNEEWQSDDSEEDEVDELEQQDSIFSRLEELRFQLEKEMGFENFIEAYNKIKAIHEDEDENIDMGPSMLQSILGTEHQHLYPKILHLVMADGAYQEDNDE